MNASDYNLGIDEWIQATQIKQTNLPDPEATIQEYSKVHTENLIIIFHSEIPQIMHFSREALNLIDLHFWRNGLVEKLQRNYIEKTLIPAVGAYLGTVIERQFEDYWIPRQDFLKLSS